MTTSKYQNSSSSIDIWFDVKKVWLGWVMIAATKRGICSIQFGDDTETLTQQLEQLFPHAQFQASAPMLENWVEQVIAYIEANQNSLNLPLDIQGTPFQQKVWKAIQDIPLGSTATYTDIAQQIVQPKAVRAVARACATNQIAVAIPCHRVIGSDGSLKGYRWGSQRKQALLEREAIFIHSFSIDILPAHKCSDSPDLSGGFLFLR